MLGTSSATRFQMRKLNLFLVKAIIFSTGALFALFGLVIVYATYSIGCQLLGL